MAVNNSVMPQQMRQEDKRENSNSLVTWLWRFMFLAVGVGLVSIILLPNQLSYFAPVVIVLLFASSLALAKNLQNKRSQQR